MPDAVTQSSLLHWTAVFNPLGQSLSSQLADALIALRLSDEAQRRYDQLAEKNTESQLDDAERDELAEFVALNRLVGILKAEALLAQRNRAA